MPAASPPPSPAAVAAAPPRAAARQSGPVRMLGRFQLLRLLGKSERSMAWLAQDPRSQQEVMLVLPRQQPSQQALQAWQQAVRRAGRLNHPNLARVVEIGEHERWPFVAYDRAGWTTWAERFSSQGIPAPELARWASEAGQGLAFAHEAGVAHHDLQAWLLLVGDDGHACVMGLEAAGRRVTAAQVGAMEELRAVRLAAETDVLALGLLMHQGLAGAAPLDEPDMGKVVARMPPLGPEIVRLPWAVPRPVPEALRAIVNRATDRQERQRYRNARTLQRALEGWLKTEGEQEGGPLALILDRLRSVGVLPAQPGGAERVAHLALMERGRTSDLAELVMGDIALSFELLRLVNNAQVRGGKVSGDGPVLLLRRAIAMVGLEGVRQAALSLRPWPGPMNPMAAQDMAVLIRRVQRAARVAVRLAPAGYDPEVVSLVTMLQSFGRLVVQYHFPEEYGQIRRLMLPGEGPAQDEPGMTAEAASFAVLGIDLEALGVAVARHWGLDDSVLHMMTRVGPKASVRPPESDGDVLRATASCANELVDALTLPPRDIQAALRQVVARYARALGLSGTDMQDALKAETLAPAAASAPGSPSASGPRLAPQAPAAAGSAPAGPAGATPRTHLAAGHS